MHGRCQPTRAATSRPGQLPTPVSDFNFIIAAASLNTHVTRVTHMNDSWVDGPPVSQFECIRATALKVSTSRLLNVLALVPAFTGWPTNQLPSVCPDKCAPRQAVATRPWHHHHPYAPTKWWAKPTSPARRHRQPQPPWPRQDGESAGDLRNSRAVSAPSSPPFVGRRMRPRPHGQYRSMLGKSESI